MQENRPPPSTQGIRQSCGNLTRLPGFTIDPGTKRQVVTVNPADTQTLIHIESTTVTTKREDGRWEGRIAVGHTENGASIFRNYHFYEGEEKRKS